MAFYLMLFTDGRIAYKVRRARHGRNHENYLCDDHHPLNWRKLFIITICANQTS